MAPQDTLGPRKLLKGVSDAPSASSPHVFWGRVASGDGNSVDIGSSKKAGMQTLIIASIEHAGTATVTNAPTQTNRSEDDRSNANQIDDGMDVPVQSNEPLPVASARSPPLSEASSLRPGTPQRREI